MVFNVQYMTNQPVHKYYFKIWSFLVVVISLWTESHICVAFKAQSWVRARGKIKDQTLAQNESQIKPIKKFQSI